MNTLYMQIGTLVTRIGAMAGTVLMTVVMGALTIVVFVMIAPFRTSRLSRNFLSDWHDHEGVINDHEARDEQEIVPLETPTSSADSLRLARLLAGTTHVSLAKAIIAVTAKTGFFILLTFTACFAQSGKRHSALRISEDNDWFTGTDKYYTNGIRVDYVFEPKRVNLLDRVLLTAPTYDSRVRGIGLVQTMYTPGNINTAEVIPDDHPYAGTLYLQNFQETVNGQRRIKVYSELDLGVIGPDAYAGETQRWFHKLINDDLPKGWDHQVESNVIVNYTAFLEKGLLGSRYVEMIGHAGADFGTTMTDVNAGLIVRAGLLDQYFKSRFQQDNKFCAYTFFKSGLMLMVQDQTLQGKLEGSQYALNTEEINHTLWRLEYGVTVATKWLALSYSTVTLSKEFVNADIHRYGNITMAFRLQ